MATDEPEQAAERPAPPVEDIFTFAERLAREVEADRVHLEAKEADLDAVNRTIEIMQGAQNIGAAPAEFDPAPVNTGRGAPRNRHIDADIDLTTVTVDFTGAESIPEWLIRIARAVPDLYLNTTQVSKLLLRHEVTSSTLHNTRVNIQRALDGHPELFRRVRAATYEYTGVPYVDTLD